MSIILIFTLKHTHYTSSPQLLPMILLFFMSFNSFGSTAPEPAAWSLHKSAQYPHVCKTGEWCFPGATPLVTPDKILPDTPFYLHQTVYSKGIRNKLSRMEKVGFRLGFKNKGLFQYC